METLNCIGVRWLIVGPKWPFHDVELHGPAAKPHSIQVVTSQLAPAVF